MAKVNELLFDRKLKDNYNIESLRALNNVLYGSSYNNMNVIIYGSSIYKSTAVFSSDIDSMEYVREDDPDKIVNRLKNIIKNILFSNEKLGSNLIIADIKCGVDIRINKLIDNIGYIKDMKVIGFDEKKVLKILDELYKLHILTFEEYTLIQGSITNINVSYQEDPYKKKLMILSNPKKYNVKLSNWLYIYEKIYNKLVLRWLPQDIINGYLNANSKKFMLVDCIKNGMTKIDLIYPIGGRYNELSNLFYFNIQGKMNYSDDNKDFITSIKDAIFKRFYNNREPDLFKGFKLIYSLLKMQNDIKTLLILNKLLLSNIGFLNKQKTLISTAINAVDFHIESNTYVDTDLLRSVLLDLPSNLDMIYEFKVEDTQFYVNLNRVLKDVKEEDTTTIQNILKLTKAKLLRTINEETSNYAEKNKLYPLSVKWLP